MIGLIEKHSIEDFAFALSDGWQVPIILPATQLDDVVYPRHFWCKRHGWERFPELEPPRDPDAYTKMDR